MQCGLTPTFLFSYFPTRSGRVELLGAASLPLARLLAPDNGARAAVVPLTRGGAGAAPGGYVVASASDAEEDAGAA